MVDTPRSISSSGTPRDDRFFSPREYSSRSARTSSSTDSVWMTPRQDNFSSNRSSSINSEDRIYSANNSKEISYEVDFNEELFQQVKHSLSEKFVSRGTERSQYLLPSARDNYQHCSDAVGYNIERAETPNFGDRSQYDHIYERNKQNRNDLNSNGEYNHETDSRQARGSVIRPEYTPNNDTVRASYQTGSQRNGVITEEDVHRIFM